MGLAALGVAGQIWEAFSMASKQEEVGWGVAGGGQPKGSGAVRSVMLGGGLSPQLSLVAALLSWF